MPLANVAIIGSGNIGTDLLVKIVRRSSALNVAALVGIDPQSDGLARARSLGVPTTAEGLAGLLAMPEFETIDIVMDATSAGAHRAHAAALAPYEKRLIDLTPAALGPFVVPAVNLHEQRAATNINMVTCGGQATIPIVAAVARVVAVRYAEIVASVASRSAGPGTRANIDEFTDTTARALESVGGADRAKAIIILNPADPPLIMRDTILCLTDDVDHEAVRASIHAMIADVAQYVPGYRLKQDIQIAPLDGVDVHTLVDSGAPLPKWKISTFLEVEGAADYLPNYAGNLDIMTSAAVRAAEEMTAAVTTEASA